MSKAVSPRRPEPLTLDADFGVALCLVPALRRRPRVEEPVAPAPAKR